MADFPSSVKTFATLVDGADSVLAIHQNDRGGEITALESMLINRISIDGLRLVWNSATSISIREGGCVAENGDILNVSSAITLSSLSLSASTWYHVYLYLSGGSAAAEVVTTAPAAWKGTAYRKTGDTSRRYVGSILTDGSGNVYPFLHVVAAGRMMWNTALFSSPFRILSGGTAASATAVSVSGAIPVTGIAVSALLFNSGTAFAQLSTSDGSLIIAVETPGTSLQSRLTVHSHPLTGTNIYYSATSGGNLTIDVLGYDYER